MGAASPQEERKASIQAGPREEVATGAGEKAAFYQGCSYLSGISMGPKSRLLVMWAGLCHKGTHTCPPLPTVRQCGLDACAGGPGARTASCNNGWSGVLLL